MPNRVLREGWLYSAAVNAVSDHAEQLYVRILSCADDFGLIEWAPTYLKAKALPARPWPIEEVARCCEELVREQLVRTYEAGGKLFGAVTKWDQRRYARFPKHPLPPWGTEHVRGGYVDPRARLEPARRAQASKPRAPSSWWASDDGVTAKAASLGIEARPGESREEFKRRVRATADAPVGALTPKNARLSCRFCEKDSIGTVNAIPYCRDHQDKAYDGDLP